MQQEFNVLALVKGEDRHVFVYDDESRQTLLKLFHEKAATEGVNFTWFDAAVLSEKAWEQAEANSQ